MAITPAQIGTAVATELPRFFRDTVDQLIQGEGRYIRDGEPNSITSQVGQAVARAACRRYGSGNATPTPRQAERYERACRPYLTDIGMGTPARFGPPFRGGQCNGVKYAGTYTVNLGNPPFNDIRTVRWTGFGPVSGPVTQFISGLWRTGLVCRGALQSDTTAFSCSVGTPTLQTLGLKEVFSGPQGRDLQMTSISRCSGADNCGDQPIEVTPPGFKPDPTPPPFRFNPGPNVDIDIDVDINNDGDIVFDIGGGPITVDPFNDPTGGGGGGGSPGSPSTTGAGGDAEEEADEAQQLWGLKIDILDVPPRAREYTNGVYRAVCYVYMGDSDGLDHDPAGAMMSDGQFVLAERDFLTRWRVSANPGYNLRVTPYYRPIPD